MRAAFIEQYGSNDVVQVGDLPLPKPRPGQIRVAMRAASINPIDFKTRDGDLKRMIPLDFPIVLGSDGAGIVDALGDGVTKFAIGDEVFFRCSKTATGTFADYFCIEAEYAALKPTNTSFNEAASLPLVGLTSYQVLVDKAGLTSGQTILIHAGAGGVGTFAIQLAKSLGAHVSTTASAKRIPFLTELGADTIVDYRTTKFEDELTDIDVVFDTLGGESQDRSFQVLRPGGILVSVMGIPDPDTMDQYGAGFVPKLVSKIVHWRMQRKVAKQGVRFAHHLMDASGDQLDTIRVLVEAEKIRPIIDSVHQLANIHDALERSESGRAQGKIIVEI